MPSKVRVKDKGWQKIIATAKRYSGLHGRVASVGIQGPEAEGRSGDPATNAMLGTVHEFGCPKRGIPERSFLRSTFNENLSKYEQELERISALGASGEDIEGELRMLAEQFRADVLAKLKSDIPPPTQRQLDPDNPKSADPALFDTGQLWNSISAQVKNAADVQGAR